MNHITTVRETVLPADPISCAARRARADFLEMPGLRLNEQQAARLWGFDPLLCAQVLEHLVASGFIVRTRQALFVRP